MLAGVVVISIAYSHRVAGPLHKLGMHARKIASGDLTKQVRLRSNDVVHELADDINSLSNRYRGLLARLDMKTRELSAVLDDSGKQASQRDGDALTGEIAERIEEIRSLVNQIRL
jgi:methyl-accepting chemotaxis protein